MLPVWLWASGYALMALLVAALWGLGQARTQPRRFALLGVFAAMMVLVMLLEVPPFGAHCNLSVVSGIVLGPQLAVPAALMVNLILALMGHGGLTVVGLNSLVLSTEMLVGYAVFRGLRRSRLRTGRAVFIATVVGLAVGTALSYGIIAAGAPAINHTLQSAAAGGKTEIEIRAVAGAHLDLVRLALIMFGAGLIGWVVEGLLSSFVVAYLGKAFPRLFGEEPA